MNGRQLAQLYAQKVGLDPSLWARQVGVESGFNNNAVSPAGAFGFSQLMPGTARDPGFGIRPWNGTPEDNMRVGAEYMRTMLDRYEGHLPKALAAYNWGPGNADKWDGRNMSALPEETRNYIEKIAGGTQSMSLAPRTIADEEVQTAQRNSPVTLADEAPEEEKGVKVHLGMGLSGLGAALAASARGESVAGDLGEIRAQYFAEAEAADAKKRADAARRATMEMVGPDSAWGQALAQGADPQLVMQDYAQQQGFANQREMQAAGFGHDMYMQDDAQVFDAQQGAISRAHDYGLAGYGHQNALERDQIGYDFQREESATERAFRRREALSDRSYQTGVAREGREFEAGQNALDRSQRQEQIDNQAGQWAAEMSVELEEAQRTAATASQAGAAAQALIAEQYEAAGMQNVADKVRAANPEAFADPARVSTFVNAVQTAGEDDVAEGLRAAERYVDLLDNADPRLADAFAQSQGWKQTTVTEENTPGTGNLSTDTGYVVDENGKRVIDPATGLPVVGVLPGSTTARTAAAEAEAAQRANEASVNNILNRGSSVMRGLDRSEALATPAAAGFFGQMTGWIGGTPAKDLRAELSTVGANIAFDRLGAMKAESPTGGALGSIAVQELEMLRDTIAALDPNQSPENLRENIQFIRQQYTSMIQKVLDSDASPADKERALALLGASSPKDEQTPSADGYQTNSVGRYRRLD